MSKIMLVIFILISASLLNSIIINIPADFTTIQAGINAAEDGDIVKVQEGTYQENLDFNGKNIIVTSLYIDDQNESCIDNTIIDANYSGRVVNFENGESTSAQLNGFTITNGVTSTSGGGISCTYNSSPTLSNLKVIENIAEYNGGGLLCGANSDPVLINVLFYENASSTAGGGIYCYNNCNLVMENVTVHDNASPAGAGLCILTNSFVSAYNTIIQENTGLNGSGVFCGDNSTFKLNSGLITGNIATLQGGGLFISDSEVELTNVTLALNTGFIEGNAAYVENNSHLEILNCVAYENNNPQIILDSQSASSSTGIAYTNFEHGESGIDDGENGAINWQEGNLTENPHFIYTTSHPYNVENYSPCINSGCPELDMMDLPETDLLGNPRVFGGRVDMGGYENQSVTEIDFSTVNKMDFNLTNYPNPFNPTTTISFTINTETLESTEVEIFNLKGQKIVTLSDPIQSDNIEGRQTYNFTWDGRDDMDRSVPSGVYYNKLRIGRLEQIKKMILMK